MIYESPFDMHITARYGRSFRPMNLSIYSILKVTDSAHSLGAKRGKRWCCAVYGRG